MPHHSGSRHSLLAALVLALALAACQDLAPSAPEAPAAADDGVIAPTLTKAALAAEAAFDYRAAASHWRTLHERDPGNREVTLAYGRNLRYSGQTAAAIDLLAAEMARAGRDPRLVGELGKAHLAADHQAVAARFLAEAADGLPKDWSLRSALGVAYDFQGLSDKAEQAHRAALALAPDNPIVLNNLALSLAQAGKLADAVAVLRQAVDSPDAEAQQRQNLALLLALQGDAAGAERLARQDLPMDALRTNLAYYKALSAAAIR